MYSIFRAWTMISFIFYKWLTTFSCENPVFTYEMPVISCTSQEYKGCILYYLFFFIFVWMRIVHVCMYVYCVCVLCECLLSVEVRRGHWPPLELELHMAVSHRGCWELNANPPQEQPGHLTAGPPLQVWVALYLAWATCAVFLAEKDECSKDLFVHLYATSHLGGFETGEKWL